MKKLIFLGMFATAALALVSVVVAIVLVVSLGSDVDALNKRTRDMVRAQKAMREDMALLRETIEEQKTLMARAEPTMPVDGPATEQVPVPTVAAVNEAIAQPVKFNPSAECEFRPGDAAGLADCIRQQQDRATAGRIGKFRVPARYR